LYLSFPGKGTKKHAPVTLHDHSVDALMKQQTAECVSPDAIQEMEAALTSYKLSSSGLTESSL